jgi:sulfur-carrier protein
MPRLRFTRHLKRYFPTLEEMTIEGSTLAGIVAELDRIHPGIAGYLIDERGALRKHVNIFIGEYLLQDRLALSDTVTESDEIFIMQALSGG